MNVGYVLVTERDINENMLDYFAPSPRINAAGITATSDTTRKKLWTRDRVGVNYERMAVQVAL